MDEMDEENRLEPTGESESSPEPAKGEGTNDVSDPSSESSEQENETLENLSSESTSTVLVSESVEKEVENPQSDDQDREEIDEEELEKEIEKELEEGVEAINKYLEEEAEFINAYEEIMGAYNAEQLYESMKEEEANNNKEISEKNEETEQIKEQEEKEETEVQPNNLKEETSELYEELDEEEKELEQHQVEGFIEEELETEPEPVVNEEEIERLQEMDLEDQFHTVHFNDLINDLYEKQEEEGERLKEQEEREETEAQANNIKEESSELYEELDEEEKELEQHQVEGFIEEELETEPEPILNEEEIEKIQELDLEKQFHTVHFNDLIGDLYKKQEEEKNKEEEKEQEKENIQEIKHQSTYLQEKLEEQEQELELEYEEKDEVEQHQVEAAIEEELETEPKPIINEEELEYIKNLEPEKQLAAEVFYELIEELSNKQNEEKEEREEEEEQEEISTEQKVAQIKRELEIPQELNSGETEVEATSQEVELEQGTTSPDKEVEKHTEVEEDRDQQQELEEILEQYRKIEQEALVEIEQEEEENSDKTVEKKYECAKKLYAQQTGKRPIYANKETKGFKQWLEQKKESEEKEKTKQQEPNEEKKKEESWKWVWKNWIENTEFDPELKSKLKKLVEEYDELEKLIKKYSQLYNKAQREKLSQAEKNELKALIKALQKFNPIKIELFLSVREIKRYLEEQYYQNDFWNEPRVNRIRRYFFTHLLQQYKSLKLLQKKKNNTENVLKNWIEEVSEEKIDPNLKTELKELIENYNELESVAIMFMKLYTKMQSEILSKTEQKELKSLVRTLQKLDPSKIELFTKIRAIKHYLNDKHSDDLSDKMRVNRLLSRFFAHFEQISYNTKNLIEDLRNEIQILSEELALLFPNRLVYPRRNAFGHTWLSRLWGRADTYVSRSLVKKAKKYSVFIASEKALLLLKKKLEERLGAKALGCFEIIKKYQSKKINTLQFVDMLEKELGRVSGEIKVNIEELSLILAGTRTFIKDILGKMAQDTNSNYNPHYKFSKERLNQFRAFLFEIFGYRAKKCFDLLKRYERINLDLKEYSSQQYTITKPHYFHNIEKDPEASYWFGFLRADGSRAGYPYTISFGLAEKDIDRLEEFAKKIGFSLDRIKSSTIYKWYKGKLKGYDMARIQFVCRPMAKKIDELGFQSSKAEQKFVPDYVVQALREAKKIAKQTNIDSWLTLHGQVALAFLLGFYDGDGTYIGGKSAVIYSSNKQFLEHIKELFEIKNNVLTVLEPGEDVWVFDRKYVSKGMYSIALGPKLYDVMINSYKQSMKRKRSPNPAELLNFLGDQT